MERDALRQQAVDLLHVLWRGIPNSFKSRYRMSIWQQFEDNIRSAAYTDNLPKFGNTLCLNLGASCGANAEDRTIADGVLNGGHDRQILKLLREETTYLVLRVRLRQQERREAWVESQAEETDEWEVS